MQNRIISRRTPPNQGGKTLLEDGLEKVLRGKTTLQELGRGLNVED